MYTLFKNQLFMRAKQKWKERNLYLEMWERGSKNQDSQRQKEIRDINWKYYGCIAEDILMGDFIFVYQEVSILRIEVQNCYNCYCEEGWNGVEKQLDYLEEQENKKIKNTSQILETENKMHKLQIRLLSGITDIKELEYYIYRKIGDLILAVFVKEEQTGKSYPLFQGTKQNIQEIWNRAFKTMKEKEKACLYEMSYLKEKVKSNIWLCGGISKEQTLLETEKVYRLTTEGHDYGAAILFCPGIAREIAKMMQGSYYILFTDSHECLIQSKQQMTKKETMERRETLSRFYEKKHLVTEHLFLFDDVEKEIVMIES